MRLDDVRGFVFDADGTLVHRAPDHVAAIPGAIEVLERIRATGRPYAVFTNGSHMAPAAFAAEFRAAGLPVADEQVLTPLCSVQTYLERLPADAPVLTIATERARDYLATAGIRLAREDDEAAAVFVAHPDGIDFDLLERASRSVIAGARLLTGSYVPAYAGASGPVLSRGAMLTAAVAKASGARPVVVGKPSPAAVRAVEARLGERAGSLVVVGDDAALDIRLGRMGRSRTVLVRSGISGALDPALLPESSRPDFVVPSVADLLEAL